MSMLNDTLRTKACKIFGVDLDSSLFESTDEEEDEEMDLDETYCEEAEKMLSQKEDNQHETSNTVCLLTSHLAHEETAAARNIRSLGISEKLIPGDIRDEGKAFEDLLTAMFRCNRKPTVDGFVSCFKKFNRSTLVRLSSTLEQHLKTSGEAAKKRQEAKLWYKNFKLTDEEREDSLRRLREIAEEYLNVNTKI